MSYSLREQRVVESASKSIKKPPHSFRVEYIKEIRTKNIVSPFWGRMSTETLAARYKTWGDAQYFGKLKVWLRLVHSLTQQEIKEKLNGNLKMWLSSILVKMSSVYLGLDLFIFMSFMSLMEKAHFVLLKLYFSISHFVQL